MEVYALKTFRYYCQYKCCKGYHGFLAFSRADPFNPRSISPEIGLRMLN